MTLTNLSSTYSLIGIRYVPWSRETYLAIAEEITRSIGMPLDSLSIYYLLLTSSTQDILMKGTAEYVKQAQEKDEESEGDDEGEEGEGEDEEEDDDEEEGDDEDTVGKKKGEEEEEDREAGEGVQDSSDEAPKRKSKTRKEKKARGKKHVVVEDAERGVLVDGMRLTKWAPAMFLVNQVRAMVFF